MPYIDEAGEFLIKQIAGFWSQTNQPSAFNTLSAGRIVTAFDEFSKHFAICLNESASGYISCEILRSLG